MSLRSRMMLSIFVFMVMVLALLTLNLYLDATMRARREGRRNADLLASMVGDWVASAIPVGGGFTPEARAQLHERLARSTLVSGWLIVRESGETLEPLLSSRSGPLSLTAEEHLELGEVLKKLQVRVVGTRVYVPLVTDSGERLAARLDLGGSAIPAIDLGEAMRGIITVMALGTVLLMLNAYIFTNRFVLRPLESLVEASNRVSNGDFSKKIPETGAYDEMARMIHGFNLMIEKIGEHHRSLEEEIRRVRAQVQETERSLFAAQRLSTAGTLAAGIAHEINNPLGGMINATRSLQEGTLDDAKRKEYLALVVDGLERVRAIVQKILQLRPRPFEPRAVALRESVDQAVAFVAHRAEAKEVAVRNTLPADLPQVKGDPLELQQAFLNILMNAVDACVMGEGVVTVAGYAEDGALKVTVEDNGCGMEEEEVARCLDPFFTTKDVGDGTGLGLSVANNIISNHGGRIDIESGSGKGTQVSLTIPALKPRASMAEKS